MPSIRIAIFSRYVLVTSHQPLGYEYFVPHPLM